ncbi:hypothetical protein D910_04288 [Dendroctonus ponderosae]|uniref:Uncharacterized protein n=1 Tax=Dendroctonus ponderosae TaxID=77166 RepID=U4UAB2_DENPD|nr:hypothetical protein D910_04288 [Dendroctonus ponderosae]
MAYSAVNHVRASSRELYKIGCVVDLNSTNLNDNAPT